MMGTVCNDGVLERTTNSTSHSQLISHEYYEIIAPWLPLTYQHYKKKIIRKLLSIAKTKTDSWNLWGFPPDFKRYGCWIEKHHWKPKHGFFFPEEKANKEWGHTQRREGNGKFFLHSLAQVKTRKLDTDLQGSQICSASISPHQYCPLFTISKLQVREYSNFGQVEWEKGAGRIGKCHWTLRHKSPKEKNARVLKNTRGLRSWDKFSE